MGGATRRQPEHLRLGPGAIDLRAAADRNYRLVVLSDGCLDTDPEVHRVLTKKAFPRQAEVTTIADWLG